MDQPKLQRSKSVPMRIAMQELNNNNNNNQNPSSPTPSLVSLLRKTAQTQLQDEKQDKEHYEVYLQRLQLRKMSTRPDPVSELPENQSLNDSFSNQSPCVIENDDQVPQPLLTSSHSVASDSQVSGTSAFSGASKKYRSCNHGDVHLVRFSIRRFLLVQKRKRVKQLKKWLHFVQNPLNPDSTITTAYYLCMYSFAILQILYFPFSHGFLAHGNRAADWMELLLEAVFVADISINFNLAYFDETCHQVVTSRAKIVRRYLGGWFVWDCISSFPLDWITYFNKDERFTQNAVLHLVHAKLLRVLRVYHIHHDFIKWWRTQANHQRHGFAAWVAYSRYSHLWGVTKLILFMLFVAHYMACFWAIIEASHEERQTTSTVEQYVADYYYVLLLLQGQGQRVGTMAENLFAICVNIFGSVLVAIVFGNVAMLVSNFHANATTYHRKMESVFATMNKLNLPNELHERIHQYYDHLFDTYESTDGDLVKFSKELTQTLALEVGLYKYMNFVSMSPYWQQCSPDFMTQILHHMMVRVYLPDDYVIRRGGVGNELLVINHGVCEVTDAKTDSRWGVKDLRYQSKSREKLLGLHSMGSTRWYGLDTFRSSLHTMNESTGTDANMPPDRNHHRGERIQPEDTEARAQALHLSAGESFGELSLLMNMKHTANVRAVTYVEMCVLGREVFQSLLTRYPEDRVHVLTQLLQDALDRNLFPSSRQQICEFLVEANANGVDMSLSYAEYMAMDSKQLANALVNQIELNYVADESIRFGFHGFDRIQQATCEAPALQEVVSHRSGIRPRCSFATMKSAPCQPLVEEPSHSMVNPPRTTSGEVTIAQDPEPSSQLMRSAFLSASTPLSAPPSKSSTSTSTSDDGMYSKIESLVSQLQREMLTMMKSEISNVNQRLDKLEQSWVARLDCVEQRQMQMESSCHQVKRTVNCSTSDDKSVPKPRPVSSNIERPQRRSLPSSILCHYANMTASSREDPLRSSNFVEKTNSRSSSSNSSSTQTFSSSTEPPAQPHRHMTVTDRQDPAPLAHSNSLNRLLGRLQPPGNSVGMEYRTTDLNSPPSGSSSRRGSFMLDAFNRLPAKPAVPPTLVDRLWSGDLTSSARNLNNL